MFTKHCSTKRAGWLALSFILSTGMILTTLPAAYAVPMMTNYQGTLKDSKGKVLKDSVVTLTFAVYEVPAGGTALWGETHSGVSVKDGAFSVVLGSVVSIPESVAQGERYLGVTVNTDAEMIPRQALVSGFFAMRAGVAESVVSGGVTTDQLGAASVTSEKVADGAVGSAKLSAGAVTSDKLAVGSVTTDQIANGAVTTEKLSTPVTMTTLNVTEKLKVGKNSLYLGPMETGGTENSIYTDGSDLLVQSDPTKVFDTVINANNAGKVGVGTAMPKAKLDVKGPVKVSPISSSTELNFAFWSGFHSGLLMFYNSDTNTAEIDSLKLYDEAEYTDLSLNGKNIFLNEKQPVLDPSNPPLQTGNVGIGLLSGKTPKNQLDVAGSVAIGSSYAGKQTAPANGLIVEGKVAIGRDTINPTYYDPASSVSVNGSVDLGGNDHFRIGPWDMWQDGGGTVTSHLYIDRLSGKGDGTYIREIMCWFEWDKEFYCASDRKVKQDIKPLEGSLNKISKLQGVSYLPKTESSENVRNVTEAAGQAGRTKNRQVGFIAQDVEAILPEVVSTTGDGTKGLAYNKMTAVLVEAVKELKAQNDALKTIVCRDHPEETICK